MRWTFPRPAPSMAQDTLVLGSFLRDVVALNEPERNFRLFGPDETLSNLLGAVFEVTRASGRAASNRATSSSPRPGGCWTRCSQSTSARDGWRATC